MSKKPPTNYQQMLVLPQHISPEMPSSSPLKPPPSKSSTTPRSILRREPSFKSSVKSSSGGGTGRSIKFGDEENSIRMSVHQEEQVSNSPVTDNSQLQSNPSSIYSHSTPKQPQISHPQPFNYYPPTTTISPPSRSSHSRHSSLSSSVIPISNPSPHPRAHLHPPSSYHHHPLTHSTPAHPSSLPPTIFTSQYPPTAPTISAPLPVGGKKSRKEEREGGYIEYETVRDRERRKRRERKEREREKLERERGAAGEGVYGYGYDYRQAQPQAQPSPQLPPPSQVQPRPQSYQHPYGYPYHQPTQPISQPHQPYPPYPPPTVAQFHPPHLSTSPYYPHPQPLPPQSQSPHHSQPAQQTYSSHSPYALPSSSPLVEITTSIQSIPAPLQSVPLPPASESQLTPAQEIARRALLRDDQRKFEERERDKERERRRREKGDRKEEKVGLGLGYGLGVATEGKEWKKGQDDILPTPPVFNHVKGSPASRHSINDLRGSPNAQNLSLINTSSDRDNNNKKSKNPFLNDTSTRISNSPNVSPASNSLALSQTPQQQHGDSAPTQASEEMETLKPKAKDRARTRADRSMSIEGVLERGSVNEGGGGKIREEASKVVGEDGLKGKVEKVNEGDGVRWNLESLSGGGAKGKGKEKEVDVKPMSEGVVKMDNQLDRVEEESVEEPVDDKAPIKNSDPNNSKLVQDQLQPQSSNTVNPISISRLEQKLNQLRTTKAQSQPPQPQSIVPMVTSDHDDPSDLYYDPTTRLEKKLNQRRTQTQSQQPTPSVLSNSTFTLSTTSTNNNNYDNNSFTPSTSRISQNSSQLQSQSFSPSNHPSQLHDAGSPSTIHSSIDTSRRSGLDELQAELNGVGHEGYQESHQEEEEEEEKDDEEDEGMTYLSTPSISIPSLPTTPRVVVVKRRIEGVMDVGGKGVRSSAESEGREKVKQVLGSGVGDVGDKAVTGSGGGGGKVSKVMGKWKAGLGFKKKDKDDIAALEKEKKPSLAEKQKRKPSISISAPIGEVRHLDSGGKAKIGGSFGRISKDVDVGKGIVGNEASNVATIFPPPPRPPRSTEKRGDRNESKFVAVAMGGEEKDGESKSPEWDNVSSNKIDDPNHHPLQPPQLNFSREITPLTATTTTSTASNSIWNDSISPGSEQMARRGTTTTVGSAFDGEEEEEKVPEVPWTEVEKKEEVERIKEGLGVNGVDRGKGSSPVPPRPARSEARRESVQISTVSASIPPPPPPPVRSTSRGRRIQSSSSSSSLKLLSQSQAHSRGFSTSDLPSLPTLNPPLIRSSSTRGTGSDHSVPTLEKLNKLGYTIEEGEAPPFAKLLPDPLPEGRETTKEPDWDPKEWVGGASGGSDRNSTPTGSWKKQSIKSIGEGGSKASSSFLFQVPSNSTNNSSSPQFSTQKLPTVTTVVKRPSTSSGIFRRWEDALPAEPSTGKKFGGKLKGILGGGEKKDVRSNFAPRVSGKDGKVKSSEEYNAM